MGINTTVWAELEHYHLGWVLSPLLKALIFPSLKTNKQTVDDHSCECVWLQSASWLNSFFLLRRQTLMVWLQSPFCPSLGGVVCVKNTANRTELRNSEFTRGHLGTLCLLLYGHRVLFSGFRHLYQQQSGTLADFYHPWDNNKLFQIQVYLWGSLILSTTPDTEKSLWDQSHPFKVPCMSFMSFLLMKTGNPKSCSGLVLVNGEQKGRITQRHPRKWVPKADLLWGTPSLKWNLLRTKSNLNPINS